jgi:hypothetical protein
MWWRILISLVVAVLLALILGTLAAHGVLGPDGWAVALIVGAALAGGLAGGFASPRTSAPARRAAGEHPTPRS